MAVILLEGLDRTGKSTVAEHFKTQGYKVLHLGPPPKELSQPGYVGPSYLDQMVELLMSCAAEDWILDRTHYGETVWPLVYGRSPMLNESDFEVLREIEQSVGVTRILMHDPNVEAHWQRCVDNKEPLTKAQFIRARQAYDKMAEKYNFERKTLKDYVDVPAINSSAKDAAVSPSVETSAPSSKVEANSASDRRTSQSKEVAKLELANAINDVMSKRILKAKGDVYDKLESDIRDFLSLRLGKIFGEDKTTDLTSDEISTLKLLCKRLKEKENSK